MSVIHGHSLTRRDDSVLLVRASAAEAGRWRLEEPLTIAKGTRPPDAAALAMADARDRVMMLLPDEQAVTAISALPRLKSRELKRAVDGWVARETSSAVEQVALSWQALKTPVALPGGGEGQNIFALYAMRTDVDAALARVRPWGTRPGRMLPGYMVLDQFYRAAGPEKGELKTWNLVFVGGESSFLCVATSESLLLTRPLPRDLSGGDRPEEYLERLATEVDRSVFFARQTEGSPEVERLIICGDPALAPALVARLENDSAIQAVYWDLAAHFEHPGGELHSHLMIPAAAAALTLERARFNLLPDSGRRLLGPRGRRRFLIGASAAVAALTPLLLIGGALTAHVQQGYLESARTRFSEAQVKASEAAEVYARQRLLMAREDHIERHAATDRDLEGVLSRLAAVTPRAVIYKDLQVVDRGERVILYLEGESRAPAVADAQRAFMTFQAALEASPILRSRGEPRRLEIVELEKSQSGQKKVEFSLEYEVLPRPGRNKE